MSRNSFPRPEHIALLRQQIQDWFTSRAVPVEITERGLNHYRCCYRFGVQTPGEQNCAELEIHFQVAERIEQGAGPGELDRLLAAFRKRTSGQV